MPLYSSEEVVQRLVDRLQLQGYPKDPNAALPISPIIVPVTQVDHLVDESELQIDHLDISGAAQTYVPYFSVPSGERWRLTVGWRDTTTANTVIRINDGTNSMRVSTRGTTEGPTYMNGLILEEGWSIGMEATGNGGDADRYMGIIYIREYRTV